MVRIQRLMKDSSWDSGGQTVPFRTAAMIRLNPLR